MRRRVARMWRAALAAALCTSSQALAQPPLPEAIAPPPPLPPLLPLPSDEELLAREGAWDRSVALEREGKLAEARTVMMRGWPTDGPSYDVAVRIAWLSLQLGDAELAIASYERARTKVGAGPEATQGLASALTLRGWQRKQAGERAAADEDWQRALAIDPSQPDAHAGLEAAPESHFDPELWLAFVGSAAAGKTSYGGAATLLLPFRITDWLGLRLAYRHVEASDSVGQGASAPSGRAGGSGKRARFGQEELWAGLGAGPSWLWIEASGIFLARSGESPSGGEAAAVRLGETWGLRVEEALLTGPRGLSFQLVPTAYVWPVDWLGLGAGARIGWDDLGTTGAGTFGLSVATEDVELHVHGTYGLARWPVDLLTASVLTLDEAVVGGGGLALFFGLGRGWSFGLSGEVDALESEAGDAGIYGSGALGLRWSTGL